MIHYMTSSGIGQPWVANELGVLTRSGIPFALHAMRKPEQVHFTSEWANALNEDTNVLYPLPWLGMLASALLAPLLFRGRLLAATANALFARRENLRARLACIAHLFVACHWARQLRRCEVSHVHSQWAYSSGTIGMYGAWLAGKSFSFTGHAVDLFRDRVALRDKIRRAKFIVCISNFHRDFFLSEGARPEQLHLAYCGIDTTHFAPATQPSDRMRPRVLGAGRLVEKKGFEYLIAAVRILADRGLDVDCVVAGSGPLEAELRSHIAKAGLTDRVALTGEALKQERIPEFMRGGDVFCLPSVWSRDNDVEGLPQLLMEAMACGLPAVSTRIVGIPDLVIDGRTGLLVEPREAVALADALERLLRDPAFSRRLAAAGREHVLETFDLTNCLEPLVAQFRTFLSGGATDDGAPQVASSAS